MDIMNQNAENTAKQQKSEKYGVQSMYNNFRMHEAGFRYQHQNHLVRFIHARAPVYLQFYLMDPRNDSRNNWIMDVFSQKYKKYQYTPNEGYIDVNYFTYSGATKYEFSMEAGECIAIVFHPDLCDRVRLSVTYKHDAIVNGQFQFNQTLCHRLKDVDLFTNEHLYNSEYPKKYNVLSVPFNP